MQFYKPLEIRFINKPLKYAMKRADNIKLYDENGNHIDKSLKDFKDNIMIKVDKELITNACDILYHIYIKGSG